MLENCGIIWLLCFKAKLELRIFFTKKAGTMSNASRLRGPDLCQEDDMCVWAIVFLIGLVILNLVQNLFTLNEWR
ncbi:hypothetical protein BIW53_15040 [Pseudoalteromonas byunsanensis]|uniref:Uncharacterized protein n=1 Tax=Pseudoalteromonas byunsanensis TaxID=327939 RepID=A0A1S1N310_9GAMM|nr:hypothetical protein BIW53_15040 [Pseudoalteromonas byunsanensis]